MTEKSEQWVIDLRKALDTNADLATVRTAVRGRIVPDSLRARYWKACLLNNSGSASDSGVETFTSVYDLEEQTQIRAECRRIAEELCSDESASDRVFIQSDLESVLTQYCKTSKRPFVLRNEWQSILHVIWTVETNKKIAYRLFVALLSRFMPKDGQATPSWGSLFRLLLLYHEPELCNFLDTKRLLPESYAMRWFCSLFSSSCDVAVSRSLWDIYLYNDDPFFVFFLALVLLINAKEQILTSRGASKDELVRLIDSYASQVTVEDLEDFCTLALHYAVLTPASFRKLLAAQLFREVPAAIARSNAELSSSTKPSRECRVEELLCLPIVCTDVLDMSTLKPAAANKTHFVFVDCRPDDQYEHSGCLPGSFHLNAVLMLQNPAEFNEQVNALLDRIQVVDASSERDNQEEEEEDDGDKRPRVHVCFCSSGFAVEDSYANMLIAHFLQRKVRFVGAMFAGLRSLHDAPSLRRERLEKHDERWCNYCHPPAEPRSSASGDDDDNENENNEAGDNSTTGQKNATTDSNTSTKEKPQPAASGGGLFGRISGIVKQKIGPKSADSGKSASTNAKRTSDQQPAKRAAAKNKPSKKTSKAAPYRNAGANVFSIADDDNDDGDESFDEDDDDANRRGDNALKREVVNVEMWLRNKPDVRHSFPCHILRENGFLVDAHLLVTESHLFVLRHLSSQPASAGNAGAKPRPAATTNSLMAVIHSRRPLSSVVKITSKRKIPELITFQYGVYDEDEDDAEGDAEGRVRLIGCDRLLIPKAGDAIRVIKQLIVSTTTSLCDEPVASAPASANRNGNGSAS